ncbi:MAG: aminotransferase class III-fold pyridoxal phosphate-dependent enzyme, partial [Candidatus Dormibacteria bacterium]
SGVRPDVVLSAKGLGSGFPISACIASTQTMERGWPGSQGGTYGGNAVACAAALATLAVVDDEDLVGNAERVGRHLLDGCRVLADRHPIVGDVRGLGLMVGLELDDGAGGPSSGAVAHAVLADAAREGLLLLTCGTHGQVVRLIPALVVTTEQADQAIEVLDGALARAERYT